MSGKQFRLRDVVRRPRHVPQSHSRRWRNPHILFGRDRPDLPIGGDKGRHVCVHEQAHEAVSEWRRSQNSIGAGSTFSPL